MNFPAPPQTDLMPPPFSEGLDDWSWGEGTPDGPSYEEADFARVAPRDADFGTCLELRVVEPLQRLRYMGEVPIPRGAFIEISAALKVLRGPLPRARVAAWPGAIHGRGIPDLPAHGRLRSFAGPERVLELCAVIGPLPLGGVDLVWDDRALYAHVGLDLVGPTEAVVRIADIAVREVTGDFTGGRVLPGFIAVSAEPLRS
jgi:hypothetical protein